MPAPEDGQQELGDMFMSPTSVDDPTARPRPAPNMANAEIVSILQDLPDQLSAQLAAHHQCYRSPAKAEQLEELLSAALAEAGHENVWTPGSHAVSTDIVTSLGTTLSVKSGTFKPGGVLEISGSRLGKHSASITAMLAHISSSSAEYYFCVARDDVDWKKLPARTADKVYYLCVFPAAWVSYGSSTEWVQRSTKSAKTVWQFDGSGAVKRAQILESMSWQLWTSIDRGRLAPIRMVVPGAQTTD